MSTAIVIRPDGTISVELAKQIADILTGRDDGHDPDPKFEGASCLGHVDLFDERQPGESQRDWVRRAERARSICLQCPCLQRCTEWEPRAHTVPGIVAAKYPGSYRNPRTVATPPG